MKQVKCICYYCNKWVECPASDYKEDSNVICWDCYKIKFPKDWAESARGKEEIIANKAYHQGFLDGQKSKLLIPIT